MALSRIPLRIQYKGGAADRNELAGYDGATSIDGITRALHIATHAYMTGETVSRATALKGASIYIRPPRQGSFIFDLIVLMEAYPATSTAGVALTAPVFYDFVKTAFQRAAGLLDKEPEHPHLQKMYSRKQPPPLKRPPADFDVLAETLEGTLQDAHRPIRDDADGVTEISIGSPRRKLVSFNADTRDWVMTQDMSDRLEVLEGNVTRYNALSRNGRAFIDPLERVVPFRPDGDFPAADLGHLTWSLHGSNIGGRNKLDFRARKVTSASGKVKRLLLADCSRTPQK
jgi:hypothetical protein